MQATISCKGETAEKTEGKAELLNKYFSRVNNVNIAQICISDLQLADIEVSVDEVHHHLKKALRN